MGRGQAEAGPRASPHPVERMASQAPPAPGHHVAPSRSPKDCRKIRRTLRFPAPAGMPRSGFRKPAHSGCCRTRPSQNSPPKKGGHCEGPPIRRRRTFTASGTTVGRMNPGQATKPGSFLKTTGPTSPPSWLTLGRVAQPGQAPRPGPTLQPGRNPQPGPNDQLKTAEPSTPRLLRQASCTLGAFLNPATGRLPSHTIHTMGRVSIYR